jgi:hypothetical protein
LTHTIQTQGVGRNEIVIGSMQDLSGPVVGLSKLFKKTGTKLTTGTFINTIENFSSPRDMFGSDAMSFSKTKHLGSNRARLSQIVNGKWTPVTDYITD